MNAPYFKFGAFGEEWSFVLAFLIGISFGFFLERAGFGSARKLVSQFYLDDLTVFKVMFTAIVTAMLGVFYLTWIGFLDFSLVYQVPTYWVAQLVGGLLLGVGFVVGGYCPGTSVAGAATGRIDGFVYLGGMAAGTVLFAALFPWMKPLYEAGALGVQTLPQALNLPRGLVVLLVVLMAVGGFVGGEALERRARRNAQTVAPGGALTNHVA